MKFCHECGQRLAEPTPARTPTPQPAPALPASFASGRYQVRRFIGEGGKKRVYLAHDTRLDRDVAFALIKSEGLDASGLARVRREAQAMGRLGDHPNIVTIFDIGEENGQPYIIQEFMEGGSVEDLVEQAPDHQLPTDDTLRIASDVCQALRHAHERGIIHRDVKPGNIWLTADGHARLGDFGLAVALDFSRLTQAGMMVGTVVYMPPEQALGGKVDARSDLYGLGAALYEMVCGRPPFSGHDPVAVISQHLNTPPVAPSFHNTSLSPSLNDLILRLLAKDPEDRPSSADEVLATLQSLRDQVERGEVVIPAEPAAVAPIGRVAWGAFVGREREMEQLKGKLAEAFSGLASVAMVVGDAGIGKTRLLQEFATYARLRGAQVLWGAAYEGEATLPYGPFAEALRGYVSRTSVEALRQVVTDETLVLAPLAPELKAKLPELPEPPPVPPETETYRLFQEATEFLKNASAPAPLVLVLEDLQWTDKGSCYLLQHLARRLKDGRVLVAVSCREAELEENHPLREALPQVRRESGFWELPLKGLRGSEVKEMITALAEQEIPQPLVLALHQDTEGNPFFVQETLKHLIETEVLYEEEGRWTSKASTISQIGLPESVRDVMERRVSGLSEECRRLLQVGSVLGRRFSLSLAQLVAEFEEDEVLRAVEEALAAQVVREQRLDRRTYYQFASNLLREDLYGGLSAPRRERLHLRAAQALEEAYPERLDDYAADLAYHYREAGERAPAETAYRWTVKAAQQAVAAYAPAQAIPLYGSALELASAAGVSQSEKGGLRRDLGAAQENAGELVGSIESYEQAAGEFEAADDAAEAARVLAVLAVSVCFGGQWAEGVRFAEKGLELVDDAQPAERAALLALHGLGLVVSRRFEAGLAEAAEAESLAEQITDAYALGTLNMALAYVHWWTCSPQKAQQAGDRSAADFETAGDPARACFPRVTSLGGRTNMGQVPAGGTEWVEVRRVCEQRLAFQPACLAALNVAWDHLLAGDLAEADRISEQALALASEMRILVLVPTALWFSAVFMMLMQRYDEAEARIAELEGVYEAAGRPIFVAGPWPMRLRLSLEKGDMTSARTLLADRPQWPFEEPLTVGGAYDLLAYGETLAELSQTEGLDECYQRLRELHERGTEVQRPVLVTRIIAMVDAARRRWDDATTFFEKALNLARRLGYRIELAATLHWYAKMCLARDAPGDAEAATVMLNEALQIYQAIGMPQRAEKVLALKLELQGVVARAIKSSVDAIAATVAAEQPDLRSQAAPDGTVTLLFTDIEGSTAMNQRLGDQRWLELLRSHNGTVRECLQAHDGYEVKTEGDGFMLAFSSARRALQCAIAIQRAFAQQNQEAEEPVRVRIGLHTGEAVEEAGDFYGKHVVLASRIADEAGGGEILVSSLLRELTESAGDIAFGEGRDVELKGLTGKQWVYEVVWS